MFVDTIFHNDGLFAGAKLDVPDALGRTPLSYASECSSLEIVNILLDAGAFVNVEDDMGNTPMVFAVWHSDVPRFNTLLRHGADVVVGDLIGSAFYEYWNAESEQLDSLGAAAGILRFLVKKPAFSKENLYQFVIEENYKTSVNMLRLSLAGFAVGHSEQECHRLVEYIEATAAAAKEKPESMKNPKFIAELKDFNKDPKAYSKRYMK